MQISCYLERMKKARVSLSKSAKIALLAVSHLSVAFVCLPSLDVADCDLVAVNCRCIRFPRVGSGCQGGDISLTVSYLVLSWLMVRFLLRHYPMILISRQKNILTLKNIEKKTFALKRFASLFCVHISKTIYENSL